MGSIPCKHDLILPSRYFSYYNHYFFNNCHDIPVTTKQLKGRCHAMFVYFQKLNGVFASVEFQK